MSKKKTCWDCVWFRRGPSPWTDYCTADPWAMAKIDRMQPACSSFKPVYRPGRPSAKKDRD